MPANPLVSVRHSLTIPDGREADIELRTGEAQQPHVVEIENKIDAEFQPGQIESYRVRARASEESGDVSSARTLLLAPHAYLSAAGASADLFHSAVSYEDVWDCLRDDSPWGRETALLVEHAIQQHRRGGRQAVTDDVRTAFFAEFAKRAEARGLPHVPPIARSAGAGFFSYPRETTLIQPKGWGPSASSGRPAVARAMLATAALVGWLKVIQPSRVILKVRVTTVPFKPLSIRWWLEDRSTRQLVIVQKPNLIFGLCIAGLAANLFLPGVTALFIIGKLLWLIFAADELFRGVNPMRRLLGVSVAMLTIFA